MGPIGVQEMIGIFLIALLLFGPKKLPELGRLLGKGLSEFRRAKNELKNTFETHLHELEREVKLAEQPKQLSPATPANYSSVSYPYPYDEIGTQETPEVTHSAATTYVPDLPGPSENGTAYSNVPSPVKGTVPRANGVQPGAGEPVPPAHPEPPSVPPHEEGHSA